MLAAGLGGRLLALDIGGGILDWVLCIDPGTFDWVLDARGGLLVWVLDTDAGILDLVLGTAGAGGLVAKEEVFSSTVGLFG